MTHHHTPISPRHMHTHGRGESVPRCPAAFTLIELLVVISIISLLIAILLPALGRARNSAQMASSLSGIRQITIALQMYAGDNKSLHCERYDADGSNTPYWGGILIRDRYLASPRIYWSPGRSNWYEPSIASMASNPNSSLYLHTGYGVNQNATFPESAITSQRKPMRFGMQGNPPESKMILLTETWHASYYPGGLGREGWSGVIPRHDYNDKPGLFSYNGGTVRSYLDGHAATSDPNSIGWTPAGANGIAGGWTYPNAAAYTNAAPWYHQWYLN